MIPDQTIPGSPETSPPPPAGHTPCEHCGALLDEPQRYCLNCGARRKHAGDPAARFLAGASRRQKPVTAVRTARDGSISGLALAAILLIPLALAVGLLVGRNSSNSPDAKLLSALRSSGSAAGSQVGGATGSSSSTATGSAGGDSPQLEVGNWSRSNGYTIALSSFPKGSSATSVARTEQTDKSKGASSVGVLATSGYQITPSPGGAYVIYSGSYGTAASAGKALASLKKKFPNARVLHVVLPSSTANTKVVSHTQYGSAHSVVGYKPSSASLKQGANVAQQDAHSKGKQASGAGLPDVVSVP